MRPKTFDKLSVNIYQPISIYLSIYFPIYLIYLFIKDLAKHLEFRDNYLSKVDNIKQKIQQAEEKFKRVRPLYKTIFLYSYIFRITNGALSPGEWKYQFFTYTEVKMPFPLEMKGFHFSISP